MDKSQLYFYYVLSKCKSNILTRTLPDDLGTKAKLIEAYEGSSCFPPNTNVDIEDSINALRDYMIDDPIMKYCTLDRDASIVYNRCLQGLSKVKRSWRNVGTGVFPDMFDVTVDCIWIFASITSANNKNGDADIHLIDFPSEEMRMTKQYLEGLYSEIQKKKKELEDMRAVMNSSIIEQAVYYYFYYSYSELRDKISCFEDWVSDRERLFYLLAATSALRGYMPK